MQSNQDTQFDNEDSQDNEGIDASSESDEVIPDLVLVEKLKQLRKDVPAKQRARVDRWLQEVGAARSPADEQFYIMQKVNQLLPDMPSAVQEEVLRALEKNKLPDTSSFPKFKKKFGEQRMPEDLRFYRKGYFKKILQLASFVEAINSTDAVESEKVIDLLIEADQAALEVRDVVQRKMKKRLWGDEDMPGTVSFQKVVKPKTLADSTLWNYGYLKASCGSRSTNARNLTPDELDEAIEEKEAKKMLRTRKPSNGEGWER